MMATLTEDVRGYLRALDDAQGELAALFERKQVALTVPRADELLQLAQAEAELVQRMQTLLAVRGRLLQQGAAAGLAADSLAGLVRRLPAAAAQELEPQIARARCLSARLRTESWTHWIIAQRATQHYTQILDLIAHCGQTSPTYSPTADTGGTGGAILDAAA